MRNKKGFNLMEIMVVVLIIAGISAVAYPSYTKSINKARLAEAFSLSGIVREAQQNSLAKNGSYFAGFSSAHISGRTRLIKANDVTVEGGKLKKGLYTVSIGSIIGTNALANGCIIVTYGGTENPVFTIYTHVEDSRIWCTDIEEDNSICNTIRSLEPTNRIDCAAN